MDLPEEMHFSFQRLAVKKFTANDKDRFLLAELHVKSLATKTNIKKVRKALENLPEKIGDTYTEALYRIQKQSRDLAQLAMRMLSWIVYSLRPLNIEEIRHAMAIMDLDDDESLLEEDDFHNKTLLITSCGGLVVVDPESEIVRLVVKGHLASAEGLLEWRSVVEVIDVKDEKGMTALHCAVRGGFEEITQLLLSNGSEINSQDNERRTPLHYAVQRHENITRILLEKGAETNIEDVVGRTALHIAVSKYNIQKDIVCGFFEGGAEVNAKDNQGKTPLHLIVSSWANLAMVQLLLERSANANSTAEDGSTALHLLFGSWQRAPEVESITDHLIRSGVDIEARDNLGRTAMLVAASRRDSQSVQFLINEGADAEARDYLGYNAVSLLRFGSWWGSKEEEIKQKGFVINAQGNEGFTALEVLEGVFEPRTCLDLPSISLF